MKSFHATFWAESLKIRKSKVFWITLLLFIFIPFMMSLLMFVQKYPEIAGKLGMIGTKASMLRFGNADWASFLNLLSQGINAIGMMGFGFLTAWIFGSEYTERTIKDLLALPVSRTWIVASKFVVAMIWSFLLCIVFILSGFIAGKLIGLTGWTSEVIVHYIKVFTVSSFLTILLCTPVAFFASYGRGYLLPMAFVILTLILANFTGLVGLGPYFPWAIPGLVGTPKGAEGMNLVTASYIIIIFTSITGFAGTIAWWRWADHH
jgi:ABC-type transport system involved in multi-copper enzyme maturation permease subunit